MTEPTTRSDMTDPRLVGVLLPPPHLFPTVVFEFDPCDPENAPLLEFVRAPLRHFRPRTRHFDDRRRIRCRRARPRGRQRRAQRVGRAGGRGGGDDGDGEPPRAPRSIEDGRFARNGGRHAAP